MGGMTNGTFGRINKDNVWDVVKLTVKKKQEDFSQAMNGVSSMPMWETKPKALYTLLEYLMTIKPLDS